MAVLIRNFLLYVVLLGLLAASWMNRDKLSTRLQGVVRIAHEEEAGPVAIVPAPVAIAPPPAPATLTPAPPAAPWNGGPVMGQNILPETPRVLDPAEFVTQYGDSLVFVTGEGSGSGFLADMGGRTFFLTNAHVSAGVRGATFTTLKGAAVKPGPASVAVGHDILAMETTALGTPLPVMRDVENNVRIKDLVVVLGNAQGGGVINTIGGSIVGLGPNLVEIDAPFQPGNSGSPIVHLKSGKVIGVATYITVRQYDSATKQVLSEPVIRRFGYRIDSVKTWQPVNWASFQAQAKEMESIEQLTQNFIVFIKDLAGDGNINPGKHTHPAIRSRIDAWIADKHKQMSLKDRAASVQNFVSFLKTAAVNDTNNARLHLTYDYFQRQLADQERERAAIARVFARIGEDVQSYR